MNEIFFHFDFLLTLGVFLISAGVVAYMSWLERQPRKSLTPRMLPTLPVLLIFGFIGLLALVHLANLYGIQTGNRPRI